MDGFKRPSVLKRGVFSILANGLSGLGSHGVPSTRVQQPITLLEPVYFKKYNQYFIEVNLRIIKRCTENTKKNQ